MKKKKWTENQLIEAVKASISLRETLLKLGLAGKGGGGYKTIYRYIAQLNLDTSHWLGHGHLKGKTFLSKKRIPLSKILVVNSNYTSTYHLKNRLFKEGVLTNKCSKCHISEWHNSKLEMHLDHINGVNTDNRIENLRLLCPNCHSQTDTYCGRNIRNN